MVKLIAHPKFPTHLMTAHVHVCPYGLSHVDAQKAQTVIIEAIQMI